MLVHYKLKLEEIVIKSTKKKLPWNNIDIAETRVILDAHTIYTHKFIKCDACK